MSDFCPFSKQPCANPKNFHITDILNNDPQQLNLCLNCFAEHYKVLDPEQQANLIINSIMELPSYKSCPKCGLTLLELSKNKKFGCNECYIYFKNELNIFLKLCQDNPKHIGKSPINENIEKIESLKEKMKKAIETENYEVAGILRDKIKELQ